MPYYILVPRKNLRITIHNFIMECFYLFFIRSVTPQNFSNQTRICKKSASDHHPVCLWKTLCERLVIFHRVDVPIIAQWHRKSVHGIRKCLHIRSILIEISPHARMNNQLFQRIFFINLANILPFRRKLHTDTRLDRNFKRTYPKRLVKKTVQRHRISENTCALFL